MVFSHDHFNLDSGLTKYTMKLVAIVTPPSYLHQPERIIPFEWESLEDWNINFENQVRCIEHLYAERQEQRAKWTAWCDAEKKLNEVYLARSISLKEYNRFCNATPLKQRSGVFLEKKEMFSREITQLNKEIEQLKALQCDRPSDFVHNEIMIGKQNVCTVASTFQFLTLEDWFNKNN